MSNIGTKNIEKKILIRYPISYKFKWNLLRAGNIPNKLHAYISYIIDILYNWTNFMSNISFIFKFIMDLMNKDDILKIILKSI